MVRNMWRSVGWVAKSRLESDSGDGAAHIQKMAGRELDPVDARAHLDEVLDLKLLCEAVPPSQLPETEQSRTLGPQVLGSRRSATRAGMFGGLLSPESDSGDSANHIKSVSRRPRHPGEERTRPKNSDIQKNGPLVLVKIKGMLVAVFVSVF